MNYLNLLTIYRDNSLYPREKKCKRNMQRPGFQGEENKLGQKKFFKKKLAFSLAIFTDKII